MQSGTSMSYTKDKVLLDDEGDEDIEDRPVHMGYWKGVSGVGINEEFM